MYDTILIWSAGFFIGFCLISYILRRLKKANIFDLLPANERPKRIRLIYAHSLMLWLFFSLFQWAEFNQMAYATHLLRACSSFCIFLCLGEWGGLLLLPLLKQASIRNLSIWESFSPTAQKLINVSCIGIGTVVAANNLGYSLNGLMTTLGIGGAAVAFASRDTFANLWGTIAILFDQPFKVGDWIVLSSKASGKVLSIGLRSTRLLTPTGTYLSIPNHVLVNEWIDNWSDFSHLHVQQTFRLNVSLQAEQMHAFLVQARQFLIEYTKIEHPHFSITENVDGTHNASLNYVLKNTNSQDLSDVREHLQLSLLSLCDSITHHAAATC